MNRSLRVCIFLNSAAVASSVASGVLPSTTTTSRPVFCGKSSLKCATCCRQGRVGEIMFVVSVSMRKAWTTKTAARMAASTMAPTTATARRSHQVTARKTTDSSIRRISASWASDYERREAGRVKAGPLYQTARALSLWGVGAAAGGCLLVTGERHAPMRNQSIDISLGQSGLRHAAQCHGRIDPGDGDVGDLEGSMRGILHDLPV